jgi:hypothetical protein
LITFSLQLTLEWTRLRYVWCESDAARYSTPPSQYTLNQTYARLSQNSAKHIANLPAPYPGLPAQGIDPSTGNFTDTYVVCPSAISTRTKLTYAVDLGRRNRQLPRVPDQVCSFHQHPRPHVRGHLEDRCRLVYQAPPVCASAYHFFAGDIVSDDIHVFLALDCWQLDVPCRLARPWRDCHYRLPLGVLPRWQLDHVSPPVCFLRSVLTRHHRGGQMLNNQTIVNFALKLVDSCWNT